MRCTLTVIAAVGIGMAATTPSVWSQGSPAAPVTGAWAGWVEVAGNYQPVAATLTTASTPPGRLTNLLTGVSRPISNVAVEGARVRVTLADPRFPVLVGTMDGNHIAGVAEATGGRTGAFRLLRIADLELQAKRRYLGAYRFSDGRFLLVDIGYPPGSDMLYSIDPQTGHARAMYPISPNEFVSGPALLVPEPTEQTLRFDTADGRIVAVTRRTGAATERAVHIDIAEHEVQFRSGDATLAGTLLVPRGGGRHPGLVFVPSAGQISREQYWGFGYLLAARGFAVLAFDKRGTGTSTGDWRGTSFEELADDVVMGARYLQSRSEVDRERIGFWGLSQGAWIAPLAAVRFKEAAFVITMSGGGLTPAQGELLDSEYAMRTAGLSDQDVRQGLAFQQARDEFLRTGSGWDEYTSHLKPAPERPWWRLPGTDLSGPATVDDPFWSNTRRFYFYNPAPTLQSLQAPLLAIFGELDTPDGVRANVSAMTAALQAGKHQDFTIRVFTQGRHNLMDVGGFSPNEYPRLQRFVSGLFETMVSWLERRVTRRP